MFILLTLPGAAASASAQDLFHARIYPVRDGVTLVAGDFNNDGKLDAAVPEMATTGTITFLGDGAGGFATKIASPSLGTGFFVDAKAGDFNKDGNLDLAVADFVNNQILLLTGNGTGAFSAGATAATGLNPNHLVVGDFNNDTNLDAVVINNGGLDGTFAPGNGAGAFLAPVTFATPFAPNYLGAGTLNADGNLDLAIVCGDDKIRVFAGNGAGGFSPTGIPRPCPGAQDLQMGDLNNDGKTDAVVIGTPAAKTARVFLSNGVGGFAAGVDYTVAAGNGSPSRGAIADMNHDGRRDILVGLLDNDGGDLHLLQQTATGTFTLVAGGGPAAGGSANALATGLLNGDADVDVLYLSALGVTPLLGNGAMGFNNSNAWIDATLGANMAHAIVDYDMDGDADVIVGNGGSSQVSGYKNNGAGILTNDPNSFFGQNTLVGIAAGDFNADGNPDVVILDDGFSINNYIVSTLLNKSLVPVAQNVTTTGGWDVFHEIKAGDFDNDGDVDVAMSSELNWRVIFRMNDGTGTFLAAGEVETVVGFFTWGFEAGDLNGDGVTDVAGIGGGGAGASLSDPVWGNGFTSMALPPIGGGYDVAMGDLNGDLSPDLVFTQSDIYPKVVICWNNGLGAFPTSTTLTLDGGGNANQVEIGDVTNDLVNDIVVSDQQQGFVIVFRGLGSGTFSAGEIYAINNNNPAFTDPSLTIVDMNGDGMRDVVASDGKSTSVLLNRTPQPTGLAQYGTGTEGCRGRVGLTAVAPIAINTTAQFVSSNAPASSLGLLLITNVSDVPGFDYFGIGILLHVDMFTSSEIYPVDFYSESSGTSLAAQFVPNLPALVGAQYFACAVWIEPPTAACDPSTLGLVSSPGLSFLIQ